jgi:hypothetical protein
MHSRQFIVLKGGILTLKNKHVIKTLKIFFALSNIKFQLNLFFKSFNNKTALVHAYYFRNRFDDLFLRALKLKDKNYSEMFFC